MTSGGSNYQASQKQMVSKSVPQKNFTQTNFNQAQVQNPTHKIIDEVVMRLS